MIRIREWLLEDQADRGLGGPPNNWQGVRVPDESASWIKNGREISKTHTLHFTNDAFELVVGTTYVDGDVRESMNNLIIRTEPFRQLAVWYLWRWAWGEWFGLRRKLFYWDLHRRVSRWGTKAEL